MPKVIIGVINTGVEYGKTMVEQYSKKAVPISISAVISFTLIVIVGILTAIKVFTSFGSDSPLDFILHYSSAAMHLSFLFALVALVQRMYVARKLWWLAIISIFLMFGILFCVSYLVAMVSA